MNRVIGTLLLSFLSLSALGQIHASGRVVSQSTHQPLRGVSVQVVGQPPGYVITDDAGRFDLTLPPIVLNTQLTFSHLGYQPLTLPVAQLNADVVLVEQSYLIGEVQVSYEQLRKLLLRRWKPDPDSLVQQVHREIDKWCVLNPKYAHQREEMYRTLFEATSGQRREYRDKGIVKTWGGIHGTNSRLRWQFDEATRTINVEAAKGTLPTTVLELTATRLVVRRGDGAVYTWVPADK